MPTCASLFTGGGGTDTGLALAGYRPVFGIEYDDAIANAARANGHHVITSGVEDVDYRTMPRVDLLWASPECKEFSAAKAHGQEGPVQAMQAEAICRALEALTPPAFVLENVVGYRRSASLARIVATLDRLGYMTDIQHLNSADFGVPQTRVRLILRAVRGGLVPQLPPPVRWVGWYAAIEDLLPALPASAFAPWQLARLGALCDSTLVSSQTTEGGLPGLRRICESSPTIISESHPPRAFLVHPTNQRTMPVRDQDDPVWTQTANSGGEGRATGARARAFIVDGQANSDGAAITVRDGDGPVFTQSASQSKRPARAWLAAGRVVAMTPRAIARFQSFPDSYILPEKKGLALTVLGNAVPPLLAQAIGTSLIGVCRQEEGR